MLCSFVFAALTTATLTTHVFITTSPTEYSPTVFSPTAFANRHVLAKPRCLASPSAWPSGWPLFTTQRTLIANRATIDTDIVARDRIAQRLLRKLL